MNTGPFVFSFLKVKEGGFLTFGKASLNPVSQSLLYSTLPKILLKTKEGRFPV